MPVDAQPFPDPFPDSPTELALDPEVLARELAQELLGDPLDEIDAEEPDPHAVAAECDLGLTLLRGDQEQLMQGLRIFCTGIPGRCPCCSPCLPPPVRCCG